MSVLWGEVAPHDPARRCTKCKDPRSPDTRYHRSQENVDHLAPNHPRRQLDVALCSGIDHEHLHRRCAECGYEWIERVADDE